MNFAKQRNNTREVNVNTRGLTFSNSEGVAPSTMLVGYWNGFISLKFHPALEESKRTEQKIFDYDVAMSTALTPEKALVLVDAINTKILPAFKEKKNASTGVPVGADSLISVGVVVKDDVPTAYVGLYKSLDETTKKPESYILYNLRSGYTVDDYDAETGNFTVTEQVPQELVLFAETLKASVGALTNANAHTSRTVDRWFREQMTSKLNEIGGKLGIEGNSFGGGGGGSFNRKSDVFANSSSSKSSSDVNLEDASLTKVNNFDEIDKFMNMG